MKPAIEVKEIRTGPTDAQLDALADAWAALCEEYGARMESIVGGRCMVPDWSSPTARAQQLHEALHELIIPDYVPEPTPELRHMATTESSALLIFAGSEFVNCCKAAGPNGRALMIDYAKMAL